MTYRLGFCFVPLVALVLAAADRPRSALQAEEAITLEQAQVGFGGAYKTGAWTPLRLRSCRPSQWCRAR